MQERMELEITHRSEARRASHRRALNTEIAGELGGGILLRAINDPTEQHKRGHSRTVPLHDLLAIELSAAVRGHDSCGSLLFGH